MATKSKPADTEPSAQPSPELSAEARADEQLGYEQARQELVAVVQRLESGGVPLEESLALWERGERLAAVCQRWLDGAKAKVEQARGTGSAGGE